MRLISIRTNRGDVMDSKIKRIEMQLKSNKKKPLSGWQLQEFINNINKGYSKLDLINEISRLLNLGERPENIIIINKSYEINNAYSYLKKSNQIDLNKESMVEKFYNLGRPISMYPNEFMKKIEMIFNLYEKLFSLFRANKIHTVPKNRLKTYINLEFDEAISVLQEDSYQILDAIKNIDKNKVKSLKKHICEHAKESIESYRKFKKAIINIKEFNGLIGKEFKQLNDEEKKLFIYMDKNYYNKFFKEFKRVDRPIILKYDEKTNKLSIIKKEYMLNEVESENFLDYKDYSHNSPFVITIIAGIAIVSIAALLYEGVKQEMLNDKKEKELESEEEEIDNDIRDTVIALSQSEDLNQANQVQNKFLKNKLIDVNEKVNKQTKATLSQNGVMNNGVVIKLEKDRTNCGNNDNPEIK
ncbi:hypothetical protein CUB90_12680 [Clostridium sp. CT7]|nr:hypothetical protein CUB90_12680 [Clostridium sp. CT7]